MQLGDSNRNESVNKDASKRRIGSICIAMLTGGFASRTQVGRGALMVFVVALCATAIMAFAAQTKRSKEGWMALSASYPSKTIRPASRYTFPERACSRILEASLWSWTVSPSSMRRAIPAVFPEPAKAPLPQPMVTRFPTP